MPTYILLVRWTTQGLQKIKDSPSRLEAGKKAFAAAGIKLREFHMTMGRYDQVSIAEAPDDATMAKALLRLAAQGNLQTETLRAFTEDEYKKIISEIG
ncbi:MAG: GYD domain-containing protein [Acidobacteria bacterium]|nr:GYD domain-containing protein [Acidobacteriota bacterium]